MRQSRALGGARWEDKGTDELTAGCSNDLPEGWTAVTGQFSAPLKPSLSISALRSLSRTLLFFFFLSPTRMYVSFTHCALCLPPVIWPTPRYGNQWTPPIGGREMRKRRGFLRVVSTLLPLTSTSTAHAPHRLNVDMQSPSCPPEPCPSPS